MPDVVHPAPEWAGHASVRLRRRGLQASLACACKYGKPNQSHKVKANGRPQIRRVFARQPSHYPVDIPAYYGVDRWLSIGDLAAALPVDAFVLLAIERCYEVDDIKQILDSGRCVELSGV